MQSELVLVSMLEIEYIVFIFFDKNIGKIFELKEDLCNSFFGGESSSLENEFKLLLLNFDKNLCLFNEYDKYIEVQENYILDYGGGEDFCVKIDIYLENFE